MTRTKYRDGTAEMVGALNVLLGDALENGQKIKTIDEQKNPDGTVDTIEVDFS